MKTSFILLCTSAFLLSCTNNKKEPYPIAETKEPALETSVQKKDTIVDANYTFEEAIAGSKAPRQIIDQLILFNVPYLSTDGKIHRGQILSNQEISSDLVHMFLFMLDKGFVIEKVIPVVHYDWNDSLSMADNNSYSFCYRNTSYSRHASGMAIDINPRFNPLRWKKGDQPSIPTGAVQDTTINGTFYPGHPVVKEFLTRGFRWGHSFSRYYDDHHFEKR